MPNAWILYNRKKDYLLHKQRIRKVMPVVNTSPPTCKISSYGKRDIAIRMEREAIDSENHRVVNRIVNAMSRTTLDNSNSSRERHLQVMRFCSLQRKKEEKKQIEKGNLRMLGHIVNAAAIYDREKWEEDAVRNELVLLHMTEFPETYPTVRASLSQPIIPRPSTAGMLRKLTFLLPQASSRPQSALSSRKNIKKTYIDTS